VTDTQQSSSSRADLERVRAEIGKIVVGQDGTVSGLLTAMLVGGHVLIEGVPGVAKTLVAKSLAAAVDLQFKRIQFTPDLMPSDITGQSVLSVAEGATTFRAGPVFTNILLADEINRTPPKTQAALLEALEERQVTVEGVSRPLPDPFMCIATQNPVEYEGTYPLPEAQLDRFLFKLTVTYPNAEQELAVLQRHDVGMNVHDVRQSGVAAVATASVLAAARDEVAALRVDPIVQKYIVDLIRTTRTSPSLALGVSPRGGIALMKSAKAWGWLQGRDFVTPDDVKTVAKPALRHRVMLRAEVELEGVNADGVLDGILATLPVPR
jgi:MoxR-like ATPase